MFWSRKSEDILIAKGIQRIQLQHENFLLRAKIEEQKGIIRNDSLMFVSQQGIISGLEEDKAMLLTEVEDLSSDKEKLVLKCDRRRRAGNLKAVVGVAIGFFLGVRLSR